MDCQMPIMVGDRDQVIEAGMRNHISKPLNVELMYKTMARWVIPINRTEASTSNVIKEEMGSLGESAVTQSTLFAQDNDGRGFADITVQLAELSQCLADYDTSADELIVKLKSSPYLVSYLNSIEKMSEYMVDYDFDAALLEVNKIVHLLCIFLANLI